MITVSLILALVVTPAGPSSEPDRSSAYREFLLARLASAGGDLGSAASPLDRAENLGLLR